MAAGRRPSQAQLALLVDQLPASFVWTTGVDLRLTSVAGAALHLLDVDDPSALLGSELVKLVVGTADGGAVVVGADRGAVTGETTTFTEGSRKWAFDVHVKPLYDGDEIVGA